MKIFKKELKVSKRSLLLAAALVLTIGLPLSYYLWQSNQEDGGAWFDTNWAYRRSLEINNPGSTLNNEDVLINLDTETLISSGKLQSDCDDLRFLDSNDTTALSYWIEDDCNTTNTKIWVRIPTIGSGIKIIYLYYGNPSIVKGSLTWTGNITLFNESSCPTGWTRNSTLDNRFLYGSSTYGTTGGTSSHSHNNMVCTSSSISGATAAGPNGGGYFGASSTHTHSLTGTVGTNSSVLPPYTDMVACSNNRFTIPNNLISIFNEIPSSGWTQFAALNNRFPRGATNYGTTGGADNHNHSLTGGVTTTAANGTQATTKYASSDGADGAITISTTTDLNAVNVQTGRSCSQGGDAVNYSVTGLTANTATVTPSVAAGCLQAGDDVMLINLQGTPTYFTNVGNYEILEVQSVSGTTVTFTTNKTRYYGTGASNDSTIGTASGYQKVMLQRVPNYTNVTLNAAVHPSPWNGVKGGVIAFEASGTITINGPSGKISADERGYRGGAAGTSSSSAGFGYGGESYCGNDSGGRGGGYIIGWDGVAGVCGGGGGGGSVGETYGLGGAGATRGGAGGGGGQGGGDPSRAGAGAGGGFGSGGIRGGGASGSQDGGTNTSGAGASGTGSSSAGGGGGGGTYGLANLSKLHLGSGGGGGGGTWSGGNGGAGRSGGGIVYVQGATINIGGNGIKADGYPGYNGSGSGGYYTGPGGGGSGGSVKIVGGTISMGSGIVNARGGAGGTGVISGGAGGSGRIAVEYVSSLSGSAIPTSTNTHVTAGSFALGTHTHTSSVPSTTSSGTHLPPYMNVIFGKNDTTQYVTEKNILITTVMPPLGWNRVTALDNYIIRGASSYGQTGGSSTHTHSATISTSTPSALLQGFGTGFNFAGTTHTHSCSVSSNAVSNLPPYTSVILTQRKTSLAVDIKIEEAVNKIPTAPTDLLVEEATNPSPIYDLTPEFSAIYNDEDVDDTAIYYQIQVNTNSSFNETTMWDSGKTSISPFISGSRSPEITYAGNTLSYNGSTYYWRIKFWDQNDHNAESPWSAFGSFQMNTAALQPSDLLTEGLYNPLNVTDLTPEFSAIFNDTDTNDTALTYSIIVGQDLWMGQIVGVVWEQYNVPIGPITNGTRSPDIVYNGEPLLEGSEYRWQIAFGDISGETGAWSGINSFVVSGRPFATAMKVDNQVNPTLLNSLIPTFSAILRDPNQDACNFFEIEVNTSNTFTGDVLWDSGQQSMTEVPNWGLFETQYAGTPLTSSGNIYYWRIRVWDVNGNVSNWSEVSQFTDNVKKLKLGGLKLEGVKLN